MFNIERKRTLLTGAASGIGKAIALQLALRKTHLCLVDINEELLNETAEICRESGVYVHTIVADLSQENCCNAIAEETEKELGGLDVLINNAGLVYYGATDQMSSEQQQRLMTVNFLTPVRLVDACFEMLLSNPQSRILNVSSMFGLFPTNRNTLYHATKYGLIGYSLGLRAEYSRYGLGVSTLCPGFVRTNLFDNMLLPEGKKKREPPSWTTTSPEVVARKAIRAIEKNKRLVTVTAFAKVAWFLEKFFPWINDSFYQLQRKHLHPYAVEAEKKGPQPLSESEL